MGPLRIFGAILARHAAAGPGGAGGTFTQRLNKMLFNALPVQSAQALGGGTGSISLTALGTAATQSYEFIVVYDPNGGFVTGGGWIDSPAGAYTADPSLTGKATFGFVARYQKGANAPDGNTQFQFHAAGFTFKSTSYEWLVVAGG